MATVTTAVGQFVADDLDEAVKLAKAAERQAAADEKRRKALGEKAELQGRAHGYLMYQWALAGELGHLAHVELGTKNCSLTFDASTCTLSDGTAKTRLCYSYKPTISLETCAGAYAVIMTDSWDGSTHVWVIGTEQDVMVLVPLSYFKLEWLAGKTA